MEASIHVDPLNVDWRGINEEIIAKIRSLSFAQIVAEFGRTYDVEIAVRHEIDRKITQEIDTDFFKDPEYARERINKTVDDLIKEKLGPVVNEAVEKILSGDTLDKLIVEVLPSVIASELFKKVEQMFENHRYDTDHMVEYLIRKSLDDKFSNL